MFKLHIENLIPVSKLRHRSCFKNGKVNSYTPSKTKDYEDTIKIYAKKEMKNYDIFDTAIFIFILFCFEPPKSWSKKKEIKQLMRKSFIYQNQI